MDKSNKFYQFITEEDRAPEHGRLFAEFSEIFKNSRREFVNGEIMFVEDPDEMSKIILSEKEFETLRKAIPFDDCELSWNTLMLFKEHHKLLWFRFKEHQHHHLAVFRPFDEKYPKYSVVYRHIENKDADINTTARIRISSLPEALSLLIEFRLEDVVEIGWQDTYQVAICIKKLPDDWFLVRINYTIPSRLNVAHKFARLSYAYATYHLKDELKRSVEGLENRIKCDGLRGLIKFLQDFYAFLKKM